MKYDHDNSNNNLLYLKSLFETMTNLSNDKSVASPLKIIQHMNINPNIQEDAQEFYLKLINSFNEEHSLSSGQQNSNITQIFTGLTESYIKCKYVNYTRTKMQKFRDLSLDITSSLEESLLNYLQPTILDGSNMYKTPEYGLQVAEKSLRLLKLPPTLVFQLNRFTYDFSKDRRIKASYFTISITLLYTNS
jgi:ubiquitin C-terminal hydrolase